MINWKRLGQIRERDGDKRFAIRMINMLNEDAIPMSEFSLKGLWEACGQPRLEQHHDLIETRRLDDDEDIFLEAMDSSAFPKITGALINRYVQDAYTMQEHIGMELVTVIPSSVRDETIVGFTAMGEMKEVGEGLEYTETAIGEKYHMVRNRKFGRVIALTAEMVKFDQTGQLVQRAGRVGEMAREKQEEIIMDGVLEKNTSGLYASWRPAGTATALYSDTSTDPYSGSTYDNVNTNALADETDIDENMALLGAATDEEGNPIAIAPSHLLTSPSKIATGRKVMASGSDTRATYNEGVINPYRGLAKPVASPWITTTLGANYWLLGNFRRQFVYTEVFPLQTFQARPGSEEEFRRDIVMAFKARFMGGCGAVSNRYVIRSTGAS